LTTLYIRHPARAEGEGALCRYAVLGDGGTIEQQGEGVLRTLTDVVAAHRRVVLLLAATDVTLLAVQAPPLSGARLKAALPGLVEEHILGDPMDTVLVAGPAQSDGTRPVAVVQRDWLEPIVRTLLAQGARSVAALPSQLCLPLLPGSVTAAIGEAELVLRQTQYQGIGLALDGTPAAALQTARALAGEAPLVLYVPPGQLGEYQALALEAGPGIAFEADDWAHWIAGAKTAPFDLAPGLGAAGAPQRDWRRWRWPLRLAALAVLVNLAGLNIEWLRLKREADAIRQQMVTTFRSAYPREPAIDPPAQMRRNIARAKANTGQLAPDEFNFLAAAFGEAARSLPRPPGIASMEFREHELTLKVKPETVDPASFNQLKTALTARNTSLQETAPATWKIRSTGAK
jgi:general secretion pathway protein L